MKKHSFIVLLLIAFCLCWIPTLTSCGESSNDMHAGTESESFESESEFLGTESESFESESESLGSESESVETEGHHVHSFGGWSLLVSPTCSTKGTETRVCACGLSETQEIPATEGHVYDQRIKSDKFLASVADSDSPASYYYSCDCGAYGSNTFFDGYVLLYSATSDYSFYEVSGIVGDASEIEIPRLYDGLRVIAIRSNAFQGNTSIKKVTLPNTIQSIDVDAFRGCTALTEINLPTSLVSIGKCAFKECTSLEQIVVPDSLTNLEYEVFANCTSLVHVTIKEGVESIGESAFANCISLESVSLQSGLHTIGDRAFDNCKALEYFVMPDTVTTLGNMSFRHAEALQSVTFSAGLTAIGNAAFQYCISLSSVELHGGIDKIGNSAFSFCDSLKSLRILGDITLWGNSAFYECQALTQFYLASSLNGDMGAENYIFYNAGLAGEGITLTLAADAVVPERLFEPFEDNNLPKIIAIVIEEGATAVTGFIDYRHLPYLVSVTYPSTVTDPNYGAWNDSPWWEEKELGPVYINDVFYGYKCRCELEAHPLEAVQENIVNATCTKDGSYDEVIYCSVCNTELDRRTCILPHEGHQSSDSVEENIVNATCTKDGSYDEVNYCSVCNTELDRRTCILPHEGHQSSDSVEENIVNATCTKDGSYDEVIYCSVCDTELDRETCVLPKRGYHNYGSLVIGKMPSGGLDGYQYRECMDCHTVENIPYCICAECLGDGWITVMVDCSQCKDGEGVFCSRCFGLGYVFNSGECRKCYGSGQVIDPRTGRYVTCGTCAGAGGIPSVCSDCGGDGSVGTCSRCMGTGNVTGRLHCENCNETGYYLASVIHYDARGGTGTPADQTFTGATCTLSTKQPTRAGFRFVGWQTIDGTSKIYQVGEKIDLQGNQTLCAVWEPY